MLSQSSVVIGVIVHNRLCIFEVKGEGHGHVESKLVCDTPPHQDVFTYQFVEY